MQLNRKLIRKMILQEMADMSGGEKALRGYMQGLPHERASSGSPTPTADYNLTDQEIFTNLDSGEYGDEDVDVARFDTDVYSALDKLVAAGVLGRSSEGYYVSDSSIIKDGNIDLSDF